MKPCTLYLVRHGQTQWNIDQIIQGHTDIPLTKIGEQQAHDQRENLKNIHFSKVYSSDLIRARRTAEILNLERQLAIETTKALRERSFGKYEGKSMKHDIQRLWDLLANFSDDPHIKESMVETNEAMVGRVFTFLREVSVAHPEKNILVATHGGVLRQVILHLGYATEEQLKHGAIQNLAFIKLECDGVDFKIVGTFGIVFSSE